MISVTHTHAHTHTHTQRSTYAVADAQAFEVGQLLCDRADVNVISNNRVIVVVIFIIVVVVASARPHAMSTGCACARAAFCQVVRVHSVGVIEETHEAGCVALGHARLHPDVIWQRMRCKHALDHCLQ